MLKSTDFAYYFQSWFPKREFIVLESQTEQYETDKRIARLGLSFLKTFEESNLPFCWVNHYHWYVSLYKFVHFHKSFWLDRMQSASLINTKESENETLKICWLGEIRIRSAANFWL